MVQVSPARRVRSLRRALHRNLLIAVTSAIFAAVAVGGVLLLDRLGFTPAKNDILRKGYLTNVLFPEVERIRLQQAAYRHASAVLAEPPLDEVAERASLEIGEILDRNAELLSVEITAGEDGRQRLLLIERAGRLGTNNTWENSLVFRDQSFGASQSTDSIAQRGPARILVRVTVPPPDRIPVRMRADFDELTGTWRLVLFGFLAGLGAIYMLMLFGILLPIRRVISTLDVSEGSPLLPEAKSLLEEVHNNLARDATLARLSTALRTERDRNPNDDIVAFLRAIPDIVARECAVTGVQVYALSRTEGRARPYQIAAAAGQTGVTWFPANVFNELVEGQLGMARLAEGESRVLPFSDRDGSVRRATVVLVERVREMEYVLAVHAAPPRHAEPAAWWREYYVMIARELRDAVRSLETRRRLIMQEKSKANVSLSRNLGHDLTNIIATAKLDLNALKALLSMRPEEIAASPAKADIFRDSLRSLLNTTKFMQEIVNLYRSFAYLERPTFETVPLGELGRDVCELFRLAISASFAITFRQAEDLPPMEVEPRLMRLALFNLLNNATDALKRGGVAGILEHPPAIEVEVRAGTSGGQEIVVADNGPGIRNHEGRLLAAEEIGAIFRLGYTTKGEGEGEGLGLNWVQTIVVEFHGGQLEARNRPEGGAELTIRLQGGAGHHGARGAGEAAAG